MIEEFNEKWQAAQLEAGTLLVEAVEKATKLGYTICVYDQFAVHEWTGKPLVGELLHTGNHELNQPLFEDDNITNVIDWLDGVAYGRTHVKNNHEQI